MGPRTALLTVAATVATAAAAAAATTVPSTIPTPVPRLAYVAGNGGNDAVYLANLDGTHRVRMGLGDQPVLAPNGKSVAAASFAPSGPALMIYTAGAPARKFLDVRKVTVSPVSWSADSRYLAVEVFGSDVNGKVTPSGLDIVDTATNSIRMIAPGYPCGASFAPDLPDRLAYANSPEAAFCMKGKVNVFTSAPDGSGRKQVTRDGASLNPAWGATGIAFDRQTLRKNGAPVFQVWMMQPDGSRPTQLTHMKIPQLLDGLVPVQFDAAGARLLCHFTGQDTTGTFTIEVASRRVHELKAGRSNLDPGGISRDGKTVLVDVGQFLEAPKKGKVETMPFSGGPATVLVTRAAQPTWNR